MLEKRASFVHPYPATKVMFLPEVQTNWSDLVATTGDYLRLWEIRCARMHSANFACGRFLIRLARVYPAHRNR